jgi:hypothetical protein
LEPFRSYALGNVAHLFLELQQLLIGHIVCIDLEAVLIPHGNDHLS